MRIIGGAWRGRRLVAPAGQGTRPTSDRLRQSIFDRLTHAPWAGRGFLEGAAVLDAFAGTGALGLEALSRGAATAAFMETDPKALAALRTNIAACRAADRCRIHAADTLRPHRGTPCTLVFLDPPYGAGLLAPALAALSAAGWIAAGTLLVSELGREDPPPESTETLAEFLSGAARLLIARAGPGTART